MADTQRERRSGVRVIWAHRWPLLTAVVVAVIAAGIYAYRLPPEFATQAVYRVRPLPELEKPVSLLTPSPRALLALLRSHEVLYDAIKAPELARNPNFADWSTVRLLAWVEDHIRVTQPEGSLLLVIDAWGPLDGNAIKTFTDQFTSIVQKKLDAQMKKNLTDELQRLSELREGLNQKRARLWEEARRRTEARRAVLETQQAAIVRAMHEIKSQERLLRLPAGEQNANLQGIALREEFQLLARRLGEVQTDLAQIESRGLQVYEDLSKASEELELEITRVDIAIAHLQPLVNGYSVLDLVNPPYAPLAPVGPNRALIVLLGGALGLCLALLVIFLVHSLGEPAPDVRTDG